MSRILLCEVGPRDGFQFERTPIPTERKIAFIRRLLDAGLPRVQAVSFVHPGRVPQMADAEKVAAAILPASGKATVSGLALNERGVARAEAAGLAHVDLSIATNEQHALENANMTVDEGVAELERMLASAAGFGLAAQVGLQTVWGYGAPGDTPIERVLDIAERAMVYAPDSISLADTTGLADPRAVRQVVDAVRQVAGQTPLVLHLHDTRGLGLANIAAALEAGVTRFDTSLGGLGGCPFIPGASGNVATEDVAWMLGRLGYETGIDIAMVAAVSRDLEELLGRRLDGRLYRLV